MVHIQFSDLKIGRVSGSSGIFEGSNIQWKYKHYAKLNQTFGSVRGKQCLISNVQATLDDGDTFDFQTVRHPAKM